MSGGEVVELWLPVVGYEGYYEVSSLGRVRSIPRYSPDRWGTMRLMPGMIRRPQEIGNGRFSVRLNRGSKQARGFQVHRIVAIAFLGPVPQGSEVDHIDNDHRNNKLSNLQYLTRSQNMRKRPDAKLTAADVVAIRQRRADGVPSSDIQSEFGIGRSTIEKVISRKSWADVP